MQNIESIKSAIAALPDYRIVGKIVSVSGVMLEVSGIENFVSIGSRCVVHGGNHIIAEVISIKGKSSILLPFQDTKGIGPGSEVVLLPQMNFIYPTKAWLGRVIDAFAKPIDGKGPLEVGHVPCQVHNKAVAPNLRNRVAGKIDTGIRALNTFLTCCKGQRMGIFSGSGVGKSMMMAMLTKFASTGIKVIALIGERGREVREFIEDYLGEEGLAKAVVVVATSDESPLIRREAAYLSTAICEYYRDLGEDVLLMMDNVTRFAMAQREIGLAAGEPPTTKGYTPSVFSHLPKLLERSGPGPIGKGSITAFYSVLVEGDDHNEPIADTVRGILDGHIVLDRSIAMKGIYPAIDILKSISRTMPRCNTDEENALIEKAKNLLSIYDDMVDMIRIGAYKEGSDPQVDEAIKCYPKLCNFISQKYYQSDDIKSSYQKLAIALE